MIDDLSRLTARVALGTSIAAHGAQKAFGWFDGPGLQGAAGFFDSVGLRPGSRTAPLAAGGEIAAGVLIATGLGGPLGPAMLLSTMTVAAATVHAKNGYFAQRNGVELTTIYATAALALASSGYGGFSLDRALGLERPLRHPLVTTLALAGGLAAAAALLGTRSSAPSDTAAAPPAESPAPATAGVFGNGTPS